MTHFVFPPLPPARSDNDRRSEPGARLSGWFSWLTGYSPPRR